jgi:hypothetical protein
MPRAKRVSVDEMWAEGDLVKRAKALLPALRKAGLRDTAASLSNTIRPKKGMCFGDALERANAVRVALLVLDLVLADLKR